MSLMDIILKDTYTLLILQKRLRALRDYLIHRLFVSQESTDSFKGVNLTVSDLQWLYSLGSEFYSEFTRNNVYSKLKQLEDEVKKLPILTLYLSFEPTEETQRLIGEFIRNQFPHNMIYDPKIDPNLIGGAALVWKGVYRDYSVRSAIDQKRDSILQSFKSFLSK